MSLKKKLKTHGKRMEWAITNLLEYTILFTEVIAIVLTIYIVCLSFTFIKMPDILIVSIFGFWTLGAVLYHTKRREMKRIREDVIENVGIILTIIAVILVPALSLVNFSPHPDISEYIKVVNSIIKMFGIMYFIGLVSFFFFIKFGNQKK